MQFHPTVLYVAGSARHLISEAVRGEGAYLRDVNGERFMLKDDPRAELAPRDIVSQAIFRCMERTQHPNVYLDLSHLDPAMTHKRFPGIAKVCKTFGLDITKDRIPVRPGAHYMIGGIVVDETGRTSVRNLWAAGEVTSSGLHGANRLASNSLIEGLVYGSLCAHGAVRAVREGGVLNSVAAFKFEIEPYAKQWLDIDDMTNSLRSLMVRKMGIVRSKERMTEARQDVDFWCRYALVKQFDTQKGWELQNLLTVARAMIDSALKRTESRGTHFRSDFPTSSDHWKTHLVCPDIQDLFGK
jgi:L-aspartate oxidase